MSVQRESGANPGLKDLVFLVLDLVVSNIIPGLWFLAASFIC